MASAASKSATMRTIFIADAHLAKPEDPNYLRMLKFLESIRGNAETLCILGDLFDFRIGMRSLEFPEHEPVLDAIAGLSRSGTRIIYLEGNHDFHLGPLFASRIGAELYRGPVELRLHNMNILLCHGDLINRADYGYRLLYFLIRNRLSGQLGHLLPAALIRRIRQKLQHASKKTYASKGGRWDYRAIIKRYAEQLAVAGRLDGLVLAHFHIGFQDQVGKMQVLSLGDWIDQYSYGVLEDNRFKLLTY